MIRPASASINIEALAKNVRAGNRVALVVPCHRVVGASGSLTGYRWGVERKKMLLDVEKA